MRVGSLCSGVAGLETGVEAALGARTVWQSEIDPHASTVLTARFPEVPNLGDLTAVDWADVEPVDVLVAGFPCQPVSQAGRRLGVADERWLWDDIAAAVGRMDPRPRLCLFENVSGLLTASGGDAMARVVHGLAEIGYVGRYGLLRSSDVGAPHRRERVFVAAADAERVRVDANRQLCRGGDSSGHPAGSAPVPAWAEVARSADPEPDCARAPADPDDLRRQGRVTEPCGDDARGRSTPADPDSPARAARDAEPGDGTAPHVRGGTPGFGGCRRSAADAQDVGPARCGNAWCGWSGAEDCCDAPADTDGQRFPGRSQRDGEKAPATQGHHELNELDADGRVLWGTYAAAVARWEAIHGPAPAPRDDRGRLNPALPEWMLGLPAGWVTDLDIPRTAQLRVLGNAVQPQVAELAARLLLLPLIDAEVPA